VTARHLFVCTNSRSSGKPACGSAGDALVAAVLRELLARGACDVLITDCGCLGPCFDGPTAVIYPDGAWYGGLDPTDAAALADHLVSGVPHRAKLTERPGDARQSGDATPPATGNCGPLERPPDTD
jgi:(2Fe-2S) ferredoxin